MGIYKKVRKRSKIPIWYVQYYDPGGMRRTANWVKVPWSRMG